MRLPVVMLFVIFVVGCSDIKDASLTPIYKPLPSGGSEFSIPAKVVDPTLEGNFFVKVSENKDLYILRNTFWENGNPKESLTVTGDRSAVINTTAAGIQANEGQRWDRRIEVFDKSIAALERGLDRLIAYFPSRGISPPAVEDGGFALKLDQLANALGYPNAAAMIEALRRPTPPVPTPPPNP